jgi:hypothetical protein
MDKVMPVMMMVGRSGRLSELVWKEFEIDVRKEEEYIRWIGRRRRIHGEEMTNGLGVWDLIVREACREE